MDSLLKKIIESAGIPGYESEVARLMFNEFKKVSKDVHIDNFGNVIAKKAKAGRKLCSPPIWMRWGFWLSI